MDDNLMDGWLVVVSTLEQKALVLVGRPSPPQSRLDPRGRGEGVPARRKGEEDATKRRWWIMMMMMTTATTPSARTGQEDARSSLGTAGAGNVGEPETRHLRDRHIHLTDDVTVGCADLVQVAVLLLSHFRSCLSTAQAMQVCIPRLNRRHHCPQRETTCTF